MPEPRADTSRPATRPDPLPRRFARNLERSGLIPPGSRVLVAVSGGIDSVVLLHLLRFHPPIERLTVIAAHFDHRMRPDSAADADWVRGLCRAWAIPLDRGIAERPPRSESEARAGRYEFLEEAARRQAADRIATAHQADDQAETVLFRLIRGTGLPGLAGIPAQRGVIVRPLLPFRRSSIARYASRSGIRFREDPSNIDPRWARNRIRHSALPALERAEPRAVRSLLRLAHQAAAAEAAWRTMVDAAIEAVVEHRDATSIQLARTPLLGYHRHIRARVIRRVLQELRRAPGRAGTRAALTFITAGGSGAGIDLAGGLRLERHFDRLLVRVTASHAPTDRPLSIPHAGAGRGEAYIGGRRLLVEWSQHTGDAPLTATFDPTALRFPLELRAWRAGDRIRLAGGTRKLKKLFVERKVPRPERHRTAVLVQADGQCLWVAGITQAVQAEPEPGRGVFQIRLSDADEH